MGDRRWNAPADMARMITINRTRDLEALVIFMDEVLSEPNAQRLIELLMLMATGLDGFVFFGKDEKLARFVDTMQAISKLRREGQ